MQSFAFLVPRFQLHFFKFPLVWHSVVSPHLDNFKQIRADPKVEGVSVFFVLFCFVFLFHLCTKISDWYVWRLYVLSCQIRWDAVARCWYLVEIQAGLQAAVSRSFHPGRSLQTDSGPLHGLSGPQCCRIYLSTDCELLAKIFLALIQFSYIFLFRPLYIVSGNI